MYKKIIALLIFALSITSTNAFSDATSVAGSSSSAGAVANSGVGVAHGGSGGQGGDGGVGLGVSTLNQANNLSNQAGSMGNSTAITFNSAPPPDHTTVDINSNVSGSQTIKNTPAAFAPNLTTTLTETCMGSSSIGAGAPGIGLSFGTTWKDPDCVRRLNARDVRTLGPEGFAAAKEILCQNEDVREAYRRTGSPCYLDRVSTTAVSTPKGVLTDEVSDTRRHPAAPQSI